MPSGWMIPSSPETLVVAFSHKDLSAVEIEKRLRLSRPAVVARIADDKIIVDLRTVNESDEEVVIAIITRESADAQSE